MTEFVGLPQRRSLLPDTRPELWSGVVEWQRDGEWWCPWRLPPRRAVTAHAPELVAKARMPAGVRADLVTDAADLSVRLWSAGPGLLDVLVDDELLRRHRLTGEVETVRVELPEGRHRVQVWLPQAVEVGMAALDLLGGAEAGAPGARSRWTTYGSSITQCASAAGPSETWPALVAREQDWDLLALGFGGQCHLDPVVAQTIAAQPADLISLCLGINVYGSASLGPRALASQVSGFVQAVRAAHPGIPIVVVSPIASPDRERTANLVGLTLAEVRRQVHIAVQTLRGLGDDRLHLVDGYDVLGESEAGLLHDGLHPGAEGYRLMAERLRPRLTEHLGRPRA